MKKLYSIFTIAALMTLVFGFTSCSDDDDQTTFYKMGFSSFSYHGSSSTDMTEEMKTIESAYKSALGVNDVTFSMSGSSKNCDKDVKAKCKAAESKLSGVTFNSTFTFQVTNVSNDEEIYSYSNK